LKAVYDISVSSTDTIGAFNSGVDAARLHRPTTAAAPICMVMSYISTMAAAGRCGAAARREWSVSLAPVLYRRKMKY